MAVVGEPLTPAVLEQMDALKGWPPPRRAFDPKGDWTHTYRIWTCHGYTDRNNTNRGVLEIKRTANPFILTVSQRVIHTGNLIHELRAEIACESDGIASPKRWSLSSRYQQPDGKEREALSLTKTGKAAGSERRTADWCLFEAIQRLPFRRLDSNPFELLEGLTVSRSVQRIQYGGEEAFRRSGAALKLHRFYQIGHGTLPYEYWLDENHRLLFVASLDKALILDPDAESKVQWRRKPRARKA